MPNRTARRASVALFLASLVACPVVRADDAAHAIEASQVVAGHSAHGETFNEGPRQRAYLMGGTGNVSFPVTTSNPEVQAFINQGVGQLHGFWYFEAERSFRQAAALDPDCAIAYWGMSQANYQNDKRSKGFLAEAMKRKDKASPRERAYIEAWNTYVNADSKDTKKDADRRTAYAKALEKIALNHPDDLEAKAFLALQLWYNKDRVPIASNLALNALLNEIVAKEPLHPVHHYVIHLWDGTDRSDMALKSAASCGQGSPAIAHMWHMPGHTYSKLKRYEDAAWQQEASARVDHAFMIRDRVMPDQIHNFSHNNEWLCRNLSMVGRARDAVDLAKNMIDLPRHPKYNNWEKRGSALHGRQRLFETLARYEMWNELIQLAHTRYLEPTDKDEEQVMRLRYLGRAYFNLGDSARLRQTLATLEQRVAKAKIKELADTAKQAITEKPTTRPTTRPTARAARSNPTELAVNELKAYVAATSGDLKGAIDSLQNVNGADRAAIVRLQLQAGMESQAIQTARRDAESKQKEVPPLATLIAALHQGGKKEETRKAFDDLRAVSSSIDSLDVPLLARLSPIARDLDLPADWRLPKKPAADVGVRPSLDSLGPFRWHPSPAPSWTLNDASGASHSISELRGKPFVLTFHLGYACTHCAGQLRSFAQKSKQFQAAGLSIHTISTDDADGVKRSIENAPNGLPFQLLSNSAMDVFKAYRCFDDFENKPLHGTFLIDAEGLVRWQDIGAEPFTDLDFLLVESNRLLKQGTSENLSASASR